MYPTSARDREQLYRFLASLYLRPPSALLIEMIRDGSVLTAFTDNPGGEDVGSGDPEPGESATPLAYLQAFVTQAQGLPDLEKELAAEHTTLFVLPSGVIPHEAFYLDREKRLGGRLTIAVERFYKRAGMDILERCIEMPDHLGVELEFMAALCKLEGDLEEARDLTAGEQCVGIQRAFMEEHLSRWAYRCCENVIRDAPSGLYKALAHLTTEFLRSEEAHLAERHRQACREEEPKCELARN